ncbi:MAG TPA: phage major capsid protein [Bradyrhizobium sp.]|nr:phage major capsid protein [Bradyrhizobium sp.]
MSYVLSDATVDRYGDVVEPAGWVLDNFKSNPIALFNHRPDQVVGTWGNVRVVKDALMAEFQPAEPGTSRIADEVRRLVEQGVLRAASVGFHGIEAEPIKGTRGTRYKSQELVETSIVSVPANPQALAIAKSLDISDDTMELVFGKHAALQTRSISSGKHADTHLRPKAKVMNISQQIEDVQARLNAARDALLAHVQEPNHDLDEAASLNDEVEFLEKDLASKQRTEKSLALRAAEQPAQSTAVAARRPLSITQAATDKTDYLWRAATAGFVARATQRTIEDVLRERYPQEKYNDAEATGWVTRAAISGALTTVPGWAQELVTQGTGGFMQTLYPISVFPRLAAQGTALTFGPDNASIKIPSRATTPSISGSFVAEAQPIPVRRLGLTSITLQPYKMGGISVYSREMAMYSNPSIEGIIRQGMTEDTAITIDTLLLDANAATTARPAGLLNGVAAAGTASTAKGYAAILADLALLTAPFYAANAGRNLVMIINPQQGMQLGFAPGPDGSFGWSSQFTSRFSIIESTTVPAGKVIVIDAADFVSVNGAVEYDISEQAVLHMEDTTPLNISVAGSPNVVAAPVQSMWQTAQIGIRMLVNISWALRRTGMIQYLTGVNWAPA